MSIVSLLQTSIYVMAIRTVCLRLPSVLATPGPPSRTHGSNPILPTGRPGNGSWCLRSSRRRTCILAASSHIAANIGSTSIHVSGDLKTPFAIGAIRILDPIEESIAACCLLFVKGSFRWGVKQTGVYRRAIYIRPITGWLKLYIWGKAYVSFPPW